MNLFTKTKVVLFCFIFAAETCFAQKLHFEPHEIDLNFPGIAYIKVVDMDGDGDLDIIGGSEHTPFSASLGLAYWRNEGGNPFNWTRFDIDPLFVHIMSVDVAYVNDDEHLDIVGTSWSLNQLVWWQNSGDPTSNWDRKIIQSNFGNAHDAKCIDLDNDGDTDIITANSTPGSIIICYNENPTNPTWNFETVASGLTGAKSVELIDIDFDDDIDIVGTADVLNRIGWWENKLDNQPGWVYRNIGLNFVGCSYSHTIDINSDGKYDVIGTGWRSNQVAYWICDDLESDSWSKTIVTSNLGFANKATGSDFDFDGDLDIVAMSHTPGSLLVFENDNSNWTQNTLTDDFEGGAAISVIDLDQDGDDDIVAGASFAGHLIWWENKSNPPTTVEENQIEQLTEFKLLQNYPNPFNPTTTILYEIPSDTHVKLFIYNSLGQVIKILVDEFQHAGYKKVNWDGTNVSGSFAGSGVYFYVIYTGDYQAIKKMILIN